MATFCTQGQNYDENSANNKEPLQEHSQAVDAAKELLNDEQVNGAMLYNLACIFGMADQARTSTVTKLFGESSDDHGELAIELLSRKEAIEFLRVPENRQHLMVDSDLETIRTRASFKELLDRIPQHLP